MKMLKRSAAIVLSAAMLAGCGSSKSDSKDTFRFASELDILGMHYMLLLKVLWDLIKMESRLMH